MWLSSPHAEEDLVGNLHCAAQRVADAQEQRVADAQEKAFATEQSDAPPPVELSVSRSFIAAARTGTERPSRNFPPFQHEEERHNESTLRSGFCGGSAHHAGSCASHRR